MNRWPHVAALYDAQLDKLATRGKTSASSSSACAPRRLFEVQLEDVDGRHRALPPRRRGGRRRTSAPSARSIGSSLQTERWPDLAPGPRPRGRDRAVARRDPRAQVPPRPGAADAARRPRPGASLRIATCISGSPGAPGDPRGARGALRGGVKQVEVGEILEPLYRSDGRVGEAGARLRGAARPHAGTRKSVLRPTTGSPSSSRTSSSTRPRRSRSTSGRSRSFRSTRRRAKRRRGSRRRVDGGWETLANAYADILGAARGPRSPAGRRQAARADVRGRARRHRQGRGDVQVRPRRRRRSTSRRSPTSIASTSRSSRGRSSRGRPRDARQGVRPTRSSSSSSTPRLGEIVRDAPQRRAQRDPRVPAHLRRARQDARRGDRRPRADLRSTKGLGPSSTTVYQRELEERVRRHRRGRDPREDRAPRGREARAAGAAQSRRGRWCSTCAARTPRRSHALANLYEAQGQWAKLVDVLEREFDIASSDDDRVNILTRRARTTSDKLGRDDAGDRRLEPRPRHRLREPRRAARDRRHPAPPGGPERARGGAAPAGRPRGRDRSRPTS